MSEYNDSARDATKTPEVKYRLGKLILLNFLDLELISEDEFRVMRDKLIDEYKPIIGELERGAPWVRNEFDG